MWMCRGCRLLTPYSHFRRRCSLRSSPLQTSFSSQVQRCRQRQRDRDRETETEREVKDESPLVDSHSSHCLLKHTHTEEHSIPTSLPISLFYLSFRGASSVADNCFWRGFPPLFPSSSLPLFLLSYVSPPHQLLLYPPLCSHTHITQKKASERQRRLGNDRCLNNNLPSLLPLAPSG